jgi:hypothetical protein
MAEVSSGEVFAVPESLNPALIAANPPGIGTDPSPSALDPVHFFETRLAQLESSVRMNPHLYCDFEGGLNEVQEQYLEIQSNLSRHRQEPFDRYRVISQWHCTEAFAALLTEHFRRAKRAAIQSEG